jgi:hypothetical protein
MMWYQTRTCIQTNNINVLNAFLYNKTYDNQIQSIDIKNLLIALEY